MKQIGERWDLMYERWGFSAERFGNVWWGWVSDQITERFYIGPRQPVFPHLREKIMDDELWMMDGGTLGIIRCYSAAGPSSLRNLSPSLKLR